MSIWLENRPSLLPAEDGPKLQSQHSHEERGYIFTGWKISYKNKEMRSEMQHIFL